MLGIVEDRCGLTAAMALVALLVAAYGQQRECECVEYWLCDKGLIVTDGSNLLDIRQKTCPGVMVCCLEPMPGVREPTTMEPVTGRTTRPSRIGSGVDSLELPTVAGGTGCGRRRFSPSLSTVLKVTSQTGGGPEKTFYGEAPWMVTILKKEGSRLIFQCGGTLISPSVVLTAAHCVENATADTLQIRAGDYDGRASGMPVPPQTKTVTRISPHASYNSNNLFNDIALIFLQSSMTINEVVDVVCGPDGAEEVDGSNCLVTGWGRNSSEGRYQRTLSKVSLELRDRRYCEDTLRASRLGRFFKLYEGFICAGGGDKRDTCLGDGGGPLVCPSKRDPNKLIQMGIVSWGIGCGDSYPTVLASVPYYLNWISSQL